MSRQEDFEHGTDEPTVDQIDAMSDNQVAHHGDAFVHRKGDHWLIGEEGGGVVLARSSKRALHYVR